MFVLPLGVISVLSSIAIYLYTQSHGGGGATLDVFGRVLSGSLLYVAAVLLFVAGALLIISAVVKTIRRIALIVAAAAILGGGGVATIVPKTVAAYQKANNCVLFDGSCVNPNKVVLPFQKSQ